MKCSIEDGVDVLIDICKDKKILSEMFYGFFFFFHNININRVISLNKLGWGPQH